MLFKVLQLLNKPQLLIIIIIVKLQQQQKQQQQRQKNRIKHVNNSHIRICSQDVVYCLESVQNSICETQKG